MPSRAEKNRTWASLLVFVSLTAFVLVQFPRSLSDREALTALVVTLIAATLPGLGLLRLCGVRADRVTEATWATVVGLSLWSASVWASAATDIGFIRYSCLVPAGFLLVPRNWTRTAEGNGQSQAVLFGAAVGVVLQMPALLATLHAQPSRWVGWWQFHIDVPFHAALVAEASTRNPAVYPWAADTDLHYTWLSHASLGFLARATSIDAMTVVAQLWPLIFTLLFPLMVSTVAFRLSESPIAACVAPAISILIHGPLLAEGTYLSFKSLAPYSSSRDFGSLLLLLLIALIHHIIKRSPNRVSVTSLATIFVVSFVLGGSKGSMLVLLTPCFALASLVVLLKYRERFRPVVVVILSSFAGLAFAQFLVIGTGGYVEIEPLSFASSVTGNGLLWPLVWIATELLLTFAVGLLLLGRSERDHTVLVSRLIITAIPVVGIGAMTVFGHPGLSQIIFWMSSMPVLAIGIALVFSDSTREISNVQWASVLVLLFLGRSLFLATSGFTNTHRALVLLLALIVIGAVTPMVTRTIPGTGGFLRPALLVVLVLLLAGTQEISVFPGSNYDSGPSVETPNAIHSDFLLAANWIRENTNSMDLIGTNKHCANGPIIDYQCESRWFAGTALSERRFLVEGFGSTWRGAAPEYWDPTRLKAVDDFVAQPSSDLLLKVQNLGVNWLLVDKREAVSDILTDFVEVMVDYEFALVAKVPSP